MTSRVVHFEIPIDEPERAGTFYREAFGWKIDRWGPAEYWTMSTGEAPGYGAEGALKPRAEGPEGVTIYIAVDDIDDALRRIPEAGGTMMTDKMPVPTMGWSAHFRDTEGNLVGIFQVDASVPAAPGWESPDPDRQERHMGM